MPESPSVTPPPLCLSSLFSFFHCGVAIKASLRYHHRQILNVFLRHGIHHKFDIYPIYGGIWVLGWFRYSRALSRGCMYSVVFWHVSPVLVICPPVSMKWLCWSRWYILDSLWCALIVSLRVADETKSSVRKDLLHSGSWFCPPLHLALAEPWPCWLLFLRGGGCGSLLWRDDGGVLLSDLEVLALLQCDLQGLKLAALVGVVNEPCIVSKRNYLSTDHDYVMCSTNHRGWIGKSASSIGVISSQWTVSAVSQGCSGVLRCTVNAEL